MKDRAGGQPDCPSEARKEEAVMPNLAEILQSLVSEPRETRNIELKSWINPESAEGIQKIARAALALRNENGASVPGSGPVLQFRAYAWVLLLAFFTLSGFPNI
ncbi:MAG: hypothetical protein WB696_29955 [Chthoniobacterales bacterium]